MTPIKTMIAPSTMKTSPPALTASLPANPNITGQV